MQNIHLNVVICTHNRVSLLIKAINSIYSASIPINTKINLLVIANACTDDTIIEVNKLRQNKLANSDILLNVEIEPRPGKSYALNKALELIKDGFICFVDDDQTVGSNYFESITSVITEHRDISIFCGRIFPDWQGDEPAWVHLEGKYRIYPPPIPVFDLGNKPLIIPDECDSLPGGGHTIVKKEIFSKLGGFSETLGPTGHNLLGSEDTDFFRRAVEAGEKIYYAPNIEQLHHVDKSRLKISYLLLMCFQRNKSITASRKNEGVKVPLYLYRQLLSNFLSLFYSFNIDRLRFYLMRLFSTLGEIAGYYKQ
ncbi:glycosyltransferase family 2 protein [Methylomonas sp. MgM2]